VNQLIKNSKFVKTAIAAAALGFAAVSAQAVTVSATSAIYATEIFAGSTPAAAITLPNISVISSTAIPAGSTITVMLQLTGAKFAAAIAADDANGVVANTIVSPMVLTAAAPLGTAVASFGSVTAGVTTAAAGTGAATATTNNANVIAVQMFTDVAIGIGGTIATLNAATVSAAGMATVGSTISVTASAFIGVVAAPVGAAVPTAGALEASSSATTVGTSAKGITITVAPATSTQKLDVASTIAAGLFTAPAASATSTGAATMIQLGTMAVVETALAKKADLATAYTLAAKAGASNVSTSLTLTAPAGYFAALGTTGVISVRANAVNACAGAIAGTGAIAVSAAFATAAAAAAATSVSIPLSDLGTATAALPLHICMAVPATPVAAMLTGAASLSGALGITTAQTQDSGTTIPATSLLALSLNGSTIDTNSYWGAAVSAAGYSSYVRVINTGSVSAPVSIAYINSATGVAGTAAVVVPSLAAGASTMLSAATIEAAVGAQPNGFSAGRLRVTAPTNGLKTQVFLQTATGAPQEVSGAQ